jgi:2-keto-4-pentenoate hydratase/2-oxohepta-3-ene-1,7-dioic acid hydratase in catechol pathway
VGGLGTGELLSRHWERIHALRPEQATLDREGVRLLAPVTPDQQFLCQGVNYRSHVQESGLKLADFPFNTLFTKAPSCITAADAPVQRPAQVRLLDYEIELGLVLRRDLPAGTVVDPDRLDPGWPASPSSTTCRPAMCSCPRASSTRARATAASAPWGRACCC